MKRAGGRSAGVPISVQPPGRLSAGLPCSSESSTRVLRRDAMATDPQLPRTRSARLTLVSLLLVPLLSLAALWGFTAGITIGTVIRDQHHDGVENAIAPSVIALAEMRAGESALTLIWLGTARQ